MMVGLAEAAERDRPEGEVSAAVLPGPHVLPPSVCEPPFASFSSEAHPLKTISPTRRGTLFVLKRQLILQLAANSKGGDIDPCRRPPHAATPESILARWLTADPKRLSGGFLSLWLQEYLIKSSKGKSRALKYPVFPLSEKKAKLGSPWAARRWSLDISEHGACKDTPETSAAAAAAADTPKKEEIPASLPDYYFPGWQQGESKTHGKNRTCGPAAKEGRGQAEKKSRGFGAAVEAAGRRIECVVCLAPFKPVGGGFLCTPCLLRLGSTPATLVPPPDVLRGKRKLLQGSSLAEQPKEGPLIGEEQLPHVLKSEPASLADKKMPKRRRFKRSASPAAARQQQQQQECTGATGEGGRREEEEVCLRARVTAAAAASEGNSSWWGPYEAAGEAPVVPALLLPLLPSIFFLHARPWPPPPPKRRRLISRRWRGLACLSAGTSWDETPWGSCSLEEEPPCQERNSADVATEAAAQEAARGKDTQSDAAAGLTAAEGLGAAEGLAAPEAAAAGVPAAEAAACIEVTLKQETAAKSLDEGGVCTLGSSTSCIDPMCPPAIAKERPKKGPSCGASCCCFLAAAGGKDSGSCLCRSPAAFSLAYAHEALPRRRRGRLSEPAGGSTAAAAATAAVPSGAAAAREIAAAAAAVATLKKEQGRHEQQTPPTRIRTKSCGPDLCRHLAAAAAAAAAAPVLAEAAKGKLAVLPDSSATSTENPSSTAPSLAATAALSTTAPPALAATAPAARAEAAEAGAAPAGAESAKRNDSNSPASSPPYQKTQAGTPLGSPPSPSPRNGGIARISQGLMVGPSSLGRGSGLGVYSCRDFSRRSLVCEYSGVLIDRGTALLLRRMRCASHVINVQMQHLYLLGFHTPCPLLGGGAFVNDGRWRTGGGDGPGVSVRFRVMFDRYRAAQRVMIVATRDIKKGEELLTSYDNDYWRLMAQPTQGK